MKLADLVSARMILAQRDWIGVDLDATLAQYDDYNGPGVIGKPIPKMVARMKRKMAEGQQFKIFTARVADDPQGKSERAIKQWCRQVFGRELEVTNRKDRYCTEIWDDRARQVKKNTGEFVGGEP